MLSFTHATFSATITALFLNNAVAAAIGAVAGLLPDLDTPRSLAGRLLFPVSGWLSRWGHRQVTHSLIGSGVFAVLTLPVLFWGVTGYLALQIGYGTGWLLDAASKTGVPALYPSPRRLVFPLDPEFRLKTGSLTERILQGVFVLLLVAVLQSVEEGGTVATFRNLLATHEGAVEVYREQGSDRRLFVQLDGLLKLEARPIRQRFEIVGTDGEALVVRDSAGHRYKLGEQIAIKQVHIIQGDRRRVETVPLSLPEPVPLSELAAVVGTGTVTGELQCDEPLELQSDPRFFAPVQVAGPGRLKLVAATAADLQPLGDLWVSGQVTLRR